MKRGDKFNIFSMLLRDLFQFVPFPNTLKSPSHKHFHPVPLPLPQRSLVISDVLGLGAALRNTGLNRRLLAQSCIATGRARPTEGCKHELHSSIGVGFISMKSYCFPSQTFASNSILWHDLKELASSVLPAFIINY
jgi:hypothetical protein